MTLVMLVGALVGAGILLLVLQFDTGRASGAAELARLDAARARNRRTARLAASHDDEQQESIRVRRIGAWVRSLLEARGWSLPAGVRADLAVMNQSVEGHLGMSVLAGVAGLFAPTVMLAPAVYFFDASFSSPVWLALVGAAIGLVLPSLQLQGTAKERRRDFRHVVSAFLDLVSMNLAGGRGVPEALRSAVSLSDGWAMVRIRGRAGSIEARVLLDPTSRRDTVFVPFHFPGAGRANLATEASLDPHSRMPDFKVNNVTMEAI